MYNDYSVTWWIMAGASISPSSLQSSEAEGQDNFNNVAREFYFQFDFLPSKQVL